MTADFGLRLPPCVPARDVADFAVDAERAGFSTVWIPDSQMLWREVWTVASLVADRTSKIGVGVAVTNFETRHVAVTASAIASLDELSGGRVKVAFGTGDSSVKTIGRRPTSLAAMREQFAIVRALLRGEDVDFAPGNGVPRPMHLGHAAGREIPLYMAASGPRALQTAGEIADGVLVAAGVAPPLIDRALAHVAEGARMAGRTLEDLDIMLAAHAAITETPEAAAMMAKPLCVSMAQLGAGDALRAIGIDIDVPGVIDDIYPDVTHAESWDRAIAAADRYLDADDATRFADQVTLIGTAPAVAQRIDSARAGGIDSFYLLGPSSYELPVGQLTAFGDLLRG